MSLLNDKLIYSVPESGSDSSEQIQILWVTGRRHVAYEMSGIPILWRCKWFWQTKQLVGLYAGKNFSYVSKYCDCYLVWTIYKHQVTQPLYVNTLYLLLHHICKLVELNRFLAFCGSAFTIGAAYLLQSTINVSDTVWSW